MAHQLGSGTTLPRHKGEVRRVRPLRRIILKKTMSADDEFEELDVVDDLLTRLMPPDEFLADLPAADNPMRFMFSPSDLATGPFLYHLGMRSVSRGIGRVLGGADATTDARWVELATTPRLEAVARAVLEKHISGQPQERLFRTDAGQLCVPHGRLSLLDPESSRWALLRRLARRLARHPAEPEEELLWRCWRHDAWVASNAAWQRQPHVAMVVLLEMAILLADAPDVPPDLRVPLAELTDGTRDAAEATALAQRPADFCSLHPCMHWLELAELQRLFPTQMRVGRRCPLCGVDVKTVVRCLADAPTRSGHFDDLAAKAVSGTAAKAAKAQTVAEAAEQHGGLEAADEQHGGLEAAGRSTAFDHRVTGWELNPGVTVEGILRAWPASAPKPSVADLSAKLRALGLGVADKPQQIPKGGSLDA